MPAHTLPLKKMTVAQKMAVLENVWDSLRDNDATALSPAWHADELARRTALHASGKLKFSPWSEAKERIRQRARAASHR